MTSEIFNKDWDKPTPIVQICGYSDGEWVPIENIIATIGDWWISEKGSLYFCDCRTRGISTEGYPSMNVEGVYQISNGRKDLLENDWILHLTEKDWFNEERFEDFKRAYHIVCKMMRVTPATQIKSYDKN